MIEPVHPVNNNCDYQEKKMSISTPEPTRVNPKPDYQEEKMFCPTLSQTPAATAQPETDRTIPVPVNRKTLTEQELLAKLLQNRQENYGDNGKDFRRLEIRDQVFTQEQLDNFDGEFSSFSKVKFVDCELQNALFKHTELHEVEFVRCRLRDAEFHFSRFDRVQFTDCDADGLELNFARGSLSAVNTDMRGWLLPMAALEVTVTGCSAYRMHADNTVLHLTAVNSDFARSEFNHTELSGEVTDCNFSNSEFNHGNISKLKRSGCNFDDIENEDAAGFGSTDSEDLYPEDGDIAFDDIFGDMPDHLPNFNDHAPDFSADDPEDGDEDFSDLL